MRWVSAIRDDAELTRALEAACADVHDGLRGDAVDLLVVFASDHHLFDLGRVIPTLRDSFGPEPAVIGCSAAAVIGAHLELEDQPGVAVMAAHLPGVQWRRIHVTDDDLPPLDGSPSPWRDLFEVDPQLAPDFVVLAEPYSLDSARLLQGIDYAYPGSTVVGALASGSTGPGATALFGGDGIARRGAQVLALWGNVKIDPVVAQGCRPIGAPARVTECDGQLLKQLDGRSPTDVLQEVFESLPEADRELAQRALHLGVVVDELRDEIGRGDFLVRNILGMHRESGVIAVGAELRPGQTVQFHVRDGRTAAADLDHHLHRYRQDHPHVEPAGVLQFSCLGRGRQLFGAPHHDVSRVHHAFGPMPVVGLFANGEIGPVGGATHVHGYTTSLGIVRPRSG